jgi:hypothetical protein
MIVFIHQTNRNSGQDGQMSSGTQAHGRYTADLLPCIRTFTPSNHPEYLKISNLYISNGQSPHAAGSHCTPTFGSRTLREANVHRHLTLAHCGKPLYPYIRLPHTAGSKCTPAFGSRTLREANVPLPSVPAHCGKQMYPCIWLSHTAGSKCTPATGCRNNIYGHIYL